VDILEMGRVDAWRIQLFARQTLQGIGTLRHLPTERNLMVEQDQKPKVETLK